MNPKEAQQLARHSTVNLTMNVYGRTKSEYLSGVMERLYESVCATFVQQEAAEEPLALAGDARMPKGGFETSSRQTVWFPATAPIPDLNLEQNCYLGPGIRRRRPQNHRTRGKADDIICFDSPADREAFGRLCRGWQQLFQQAGRDRGWHADSTADLTRVLRIPGFVR